MKLLLIILALIVCTCPTSNALGSSEHTFEFEELEPYGEPVEELKSMAIIKDLFLGINEGHVAFTTSGSIGLLEKTKRISVVVPECSDLRYVRVDINNIFGPPSVKFEWESRSVVIQYSALQVSVSQYTVSAKVVEGTCSSGSHSDHPGKPVEVLEIVG